MDNQAGMERYEKSPFVLFMSILCHFQMCYYVGVKEYQTTQTVSIFSMQFFSWEKPWREEVVWMLTEDEKNNLELLQYIKEHSTLNISKIQAELELEKSRRYLEQHKYEIYQGANGDYYSYLPDASKPNGRRKIHRKTKESITKVIVDFYYRQEQETEKAPSFAECFEIWQGFSLENFKVSKNTYDRRQNDFDRFLKDTSFANAPIDTLGESEILDFLDDILKKYYQKIARKAFNNMKSLIKGTFDFSKSRLRMNCILPEYTLSSYVVSSRQFKSSGQKAQVFKNDETDKLIQKITTEHWNDLRYLGLLFMLFTGVRLGELVTLQTDDFLPNQKLYIQRTLTKEKDENGHSKRVVSSFTKTEKSNAEIYLSEDALMTARQIRKVRFQNGITCKWFFSENNEDYIADTIFDKTIRKLCRDLQIEERGCHKLRKTYCSQLLDQGVSEKVVQNQLRHSDIKTTQTHYHFGVKEDKAIRESINSVKQLSKFLPACNH